MSKKYNEYKKLNLPAVADEILEFWEKNDIFQKSIDTREGHEPFVFYEGPPSANGMPGIHHVMARTIKDIFCRYRTLKGYQVKRLHHSALFAKGGNGIEFARIEPTRNLS